MWPFNTAAKRERVMAERRAWRAEERKNLYTRSPAGKAQIQFRNTMLGAPQAIQQVFLDAEDLCSPESGAQFSVEDFFQLAASIKTGQFKSNFLTNSDSEDMAFFSALTTGFNAVMSQLPPKGNGSMMVDLKTIDGALLAQVLRHSLDGLGMASPILGPLVNNQMLLDNLAHSRKAPKDQYQISKLLLAGTPFSRLPDLRVPF